MSKFKGITKISFGENILEKSSNEKWNPEPCGIKTVLNLKFGHVMEVAGKGPKFKALICAVLLPRISNPIEPRIE